VSGRGIRALAQALQAGKAPHLERLYLWDTPGLAEEAASMELALALADGACPNMTELGGSPSQAAVDLLWRRAPAIQVV
jgi:hypothetical protein